MPQRCIWRGRRGPQGRPWCSKCAISDSKQEVSRCRYGGERSTPSWKMLGFATLGNLCFQITLNFTEAVVRIHWHLAKVKMLLLFPVYPTSSPARNPRLTTAMYSDYTGYAHWAPAVYQLRASVLQVKVSLETVLDADSLLSPHRTGGSSEWVGKELGWSPTKSHDW